MLSAGRRACDTQKRIFIMKRYSLRLSAALTGLALIPGLGASQTLAQTPGKPLDEAVVSTLHDCQARFSQCRTTTQNAAGILVFPSVVKADLIIGGSGGKGALIENGKITGYYSLGSASAGLQAGVQNASQVYVFKTQSALNELKQSQDWNVGATSNVTLMAADANARASTASVYAFVFDAKGLHAGLSLDVFDVWKTGGARPANG
jgi:lipid-binding SYLF domain-containing protein